MNIYNTRTDMIKSLVPKNGTYIEIGVFEGTFSKQLLDILDPEQLILIDFFEGTVGSGDCDGNNFKNVDLNIIYNNLLTYSKIYKNIIVKKGNSIDILSNIDNDSIDMIYIDGDHSYEGCKNDLELSYNKIKNNGWIMGHDYGINLKKCKTNYNFGVKQAVDEFIKNKNLKIHSIAEDGCISYAIHVLK